MIWSYLSLAAGIAFVVIGQLSLKEGVLRSPSLSAGLSVLANPYVIAAMLAYLIGSLFYIYAIKQIPLSVAFPSVSVSYVVVAFLAHWIWGEPFGKASLLALAFIGAGVYVLSREA